MQNFSSILKHYENQKSLNPSYTQNKQSPFFKPFIQPKLSINQPTDAYEQEADAVAEHVMRIPDNTNTFFKPAPNSIQRKCAHCEQEEKQVQKKEEGHHTNMNLSASVHETINSTGKALDSGTKNFMESRFGYDFSNVQVHNDSMAHQFSAEINAKAYTHSNHIAFAEGEYQPETNDGKKLLAHELAHVVQQNVNGSTMVNRKVNSSSSCSPRIDKTAPPEPLRFIRIADMLAGSSLSSAIFLLKMDLMPNSSGNLSGSAFDAYKLRFGDPPPVKNKFKNRFNGSTHDSLVAAQASEMESLIKRLESIQSLLDSGITYHCMGTGTWKAGGLTFSKCDDGSVMKARGKVDAMGICPFFWQDKADDPDITIIHELFHIKFNFGDHDKKPFAQSDKERFSEPQCYAGFVADVTNSSSTDESCPLVKKTI